MSTPAKHKMVPFSAEQDEQLVEYVAEYPAVYDSGHKDYKDQKQRENTWQKISEEMNRTVADCKKRWRSIRDTYMKQRKASIGSTGSAAKSKTKWPLLAHLEFLNMVSYERNSIINATINESQVEDENNCQVIEDVPSDDEVQSNTDISDRNAHPEEISLVVGEKRKSAESYSSTGVGKRRKDTNAALIQVFQKRCQQRDKVIEQLCTKTSDISSSDTDAVSLFFKSIAMTVSTFPPELIIEAKSRVHQIINDLELRSLAVKQQLQLPRTSQPQPQQHSRPSTSHSHVSTEAGSYYSNFTSSLDFDGESDYTIL